jgi:hypothetical protein
VSLILVLLAALGVVASGGLCLRLAGIHATNGHLRAGLAIAAGLVVLMLALYLPFALTGHVYFWPATLWIALVLCVALIDGGRAWIRARTHAHAGPSAPRYVADLVPVIGWGAVAALLAFFAVRSAFSGYDERAIYGIKAKALLCERSVRGPLFRDVDSVNFHRDYPLGLPLVMAWTAQISHGAPEDPSGEGGASAAEWVRRYGAVESYAMLAALWPLGLLLIAWGWMRDLGLSTRVRAWLVSASLPLALIVPSIGGPSWSWSGADIPLALLVGAAAVLFRDSTRGPSTSTGFKGAVVGGVLLAAGLLLKQDALLSLVAFGAALAVLRAPPRTWLALALGASAAWALVAWAGRDIPEPLHADRYFESLSLDALGTYLQRAPLLTERAVSALTRQKMIFFWGGALFLGVVHGWRSGGVERALATWVTAHAALTLGVFLVTPHALDWHVSTALTRVMSHSGVPAGALLVAALADFARRRLVAEAPRGSSSGPPG